MKILFRVFSTIYVIFMILLIQYYSYIKYLPCTDCMPLMPTFSFLYGRSFLGTWKLSVVQIPIAMSPPYSWTQLSPTFILLIIGNIFYGQLWALSKKIMLFRFRGFQALVLWFMLALGDFLQFIHYSFNLCFRTYIYDSYYNFHLSFV